MAKLDEKALAVARIYCRAMLDLAESQGAGETLGSELRELTGLMASDPGFAGFVASPLVGEKARERSLETMFRGRASDLLVDSLQILNRKGRLALLPTVAALYDEAHRERHGRAEVRVKTAVPLDADLRAKLIAQVRKTTGKTPELVEEVVPGLLGGLVLRIGDRKIDASVRRRLDGLAEALETRSAREIFKTRLEGDAAPAA